MRTPLMKNSSQIIATNLVDKMAYLGSIIALVIFGLIAGFFYAYSVDVMPALDKLPPLEAIRAMQEINIAVRNPVFFTTFFGPLIIGTITFILYAIARNKKAAVYMFFASLIYFTTAFLPTASINVPMNIDLGLLTETGNDIKTMMIWKDYSAKWTFWNTARTIGSTVALLFVGLSLSAQK